MSKPENKSKIGILGLSRSGLAVAQYASTVLQQPCLLSEYNGTLSATQAEQAKQLASLPQVTLETGGHQQFLSELPHYQYVVASPGIKPSSAVLQACLLAGIPVISEVQFAWNQQQALKWIVITGTNGKTTTTSLIAHFLQAASWHAPTCGNIGVPVTSVLGEPQQHDKKMALVVEASSAQLAFSPNLTPYIGVFSNFQPDHLDWHGSLEQYWQDKSQLFAAHPKRCTYRVLNALDERLQTLGTFDDPSIVWFSTQARAVESAVHKIWLENDTFYYQAPQYLQPVAIAPKAALQLPGMHNVENALAAMAAVLVLEVPHQQVDAALRSFNSVAHRIERIRHWRNFTFYNDSKATNPEATMACVQAFIDTNQPFVLLLGGKDKGTSLEALGALLQKSPARQIIVYGQAKERFVRELCEPFALPYQVASDMRAALAAALAVAHAETTTAIILSPACASFDAFDNFEARGDAFRHAVLALPE